MKHWRMQDDVLWPSPMSILHVGGIVAETIGTDLPSITKFWAEKRVLGSTVGV